MTRALPLGALALASLFVTGCGARTLLNETEADGEARDGGADAAFDAIALPDVPRRDIFSAPDVGPDGMNPPDVGAFADVPFFPDTPGPDTPGLGIDCRRDEDCDGPQVCARAPAGGTADLSPVELRCANDVAAATDGAECLETSDCGRGLCLVADRCVAPCVRDSDCGPAFRCADTYARASRSSLQTMRACVEEVSGGPEWDVSVTPLDRPISFGDRIALPGRLPGRINLSILEGLNQGEARALATDDGETLFDFSGAFDGSQVNPFVPLDFITTVLLPISPRSPVASGYGLILGPSRPRDLSGREIQISGSAGGDTIDVDMFYFPAAVTVGGDRRIPARLEGLLARFEDLLLESSGIRIGAIRHHPVVGRLARRLTVAPLVDRTHPNLDEARGLSAGLDRPSVSFFWMRDIELVLGTAGNIPGPWGVHGSVQSGIGLNGDAIMESMGFIRAEVTLVHELGHFLGLFHTTEADGSVFDPLDDSPSCTTDTNGDGVFEPSECLIAGENIMFWGPVMASSLSADQREVMQNALLVR
ncbi:MAG: hypothetical protein ACI9KE_001567 [Polyangiales bacterium]